MNLRRKAERFLRRLFHRKKRRVSDKAFQRLLDIHLKLHREFLGTGNQGLIVDGQFYESAVEKYTERMTAKHNVPQEKNPEDAFDTKLSLVFDDVPVVRVSKIPELLLLLGVRIKG
jgi:hypothetical protein